MKHRLLTGALAVAFAIGAAAAPITPEEALARISGSKHKAIDAAGAPKLVHTALTAAGAPAVYVFDRAAGYMLLSADDAAVPVLGYSDSGSFDAANIPPAMQWWLEEYGRQIEFASSRTSAPAGAQAAALAASREGRSAVAPMLKTDWDQVEPYNNQCPLIGTARTYTGCVATAMAQVMKYYEYPERGQGHISYDAETVQKRLELDFSKQAFEWDKMLDTYIPGQYTEEQADAVAYLMKAAGYAVKMDYGTDSSGALAMLIRNGLVRYFNYDGNTRYTMRVLYSATDWENLIYGEVAAGRPVLYGGASIIGGGHSFVCDGYDGEGYFHFNWGWTGMSNGYYSLNALNPDALGSGGGSGGGYNFTQDAVVGIQPPTGAPVEPQPNVITQQGALKGTVNGTTLNISLDVIDDAMWANYNPSSMNVQFGARFELQGSEAAPVCTQIAGGARGVNIPAGYGINSSNLKPKAELAGLLTQDGTYKMTVVTRETGSDAWLPAVPYYGYNDHVLVTKNGDTFTAVNPATPLISIKDGGFSSKLYYGATTRVWIELENSTDYELTSGFAPVLTQGSSLVFLGESKLITLKPHTNETIEWVTDMNPLQQNMQGITTDTEYYLTFMDEETYSIFSKDIYKSVTMKPNPGKPSVTLTVAPTIVNASYHDTATMTNGTTEIYGVPNPNEIIVESEIRLTQGYFGYPTLACITTDPDKTGMVDLITYGLTPSVLLDQTNQTATVRCTISFPQMQGNKLYPLMIAFSAGTSIYPVGGARPVLIEMDMTGIENVSAEGSLSLAYDAATHTLSAHSATDIMRIEAYSVAGALVAAADGASTLSLADAPAGVIIATARDARGNTRTIKLAR